MVNLTSQQFTHLASGVESIVTVLALLVGGAWTYRRFVKRREEYPKLAFDPVIRFVAEAEQVWMAEVVAQIENKGEVRQIIRDLKYEIALCATPPSEAAASTGSIASILSTQKLEARSWLPDDCDYLFVEPGVKSDFYACVSLPKSASLVCLRGDFSSGEKGKDEFFFGERLFAVPKAGTQLAQTGSGSSAQT